MHDALRVAAEPAYVHAERNVGSRQQPDAEHASQCRLGYEGVDDSRRLAAQTRMQEAFQVEHHRVLSAGHHVLLVCVDRLKGMQKRELGAETAEVAVDRLLVIAAGR